MKPFDGLKRNKTDQRELFDRSTAVEVLLRARIADLEERSDRMDSRFGLLQAEWTEMLDRLTKAWRRAERANHRAAATETPEEVPEPVEESTDPFSMKLQQIRRQGGAIP